MTRPGELFYRRLAALGILCDLGRVLKQVPISQGLSAAFVSAGWPGTGPGKRRKIRLRAPRPPPWAGGEIAANLECLLYYIAVFLLSTHITDPSCARLMWPGHGGLFHPSQPAHATQGRGLLHHHDLRERVPLVVTQALAAEPKGQPRARCCCCLFSWSSIFLYLGSSSPFFDCGCGPSRPARLR